MAKPSPFDYVKSINHKDYKYDLVGYVPFLTNRSFAMHMDTVLFAEQMNQFHKLGPELHEQRREDARAQVLEVG